MELNRLEMFKKIMSVTNINMTIFKKDHSNLDLIDNRLRMRLYKDFSYSDAFELFNFQEKEDALISITDDFLLNYLLLRIPGKYVSEKDTPWLSAGPFSEGRRSPDDIYSIMKRKGIPERLFHDISDFYNSTPVVENISVLQQFVRLLASSLFELEYRLEYLPADYVLFHTGNHVFNSINDNPQISRESIAERYEMENELMAAISVGDYEKAHHMQGKIITYHVRPRSKNPLRNQQHLAIVLNTLCRKAAESGGVHPLYIDDLSTRFAVLINEVDSIGDLNVLSGEMIHKYCLLVKNYAMKGYSAVIKEIISYIDFHYSEDLSLNRFADMFNISKTYLSNLFKKETGVTLTDYIHQTRMKKAITLINSSTLPVTAIATACGYNDINYFIRIFKRTYGLSPKQYQKTIMCSAR